MPSATSGHCDTAKTFVEHRKDFCDNDEASVEHRGGVITAGVRRSNALSAKGGFRGNGVISAERRGGLTTRGVLTCPVALINSANQSDSVLS